MPSRRLVLCTAVSCRAPHVLERPRKESARRAWHTDDSGLWSVDSGRWILDSGRSGRPGLWEADLDNLASQNPLCLRASGRHQQNEPPSSVQGLLVLFGSNLRHDLFSVVASLWNLRVCDTESRVTASPFPWRLAKIPQDRQKV